MEQKSKLRFLITISGITILVFAVCAGLLLFFVTWITTGFWGWPNHRIRSQNVERSLEQTVEALPQIEGVDLLLSHYEFTSAHSMVPKKLQKALRKNGVPPCYYATAWFISGTNMSEKEVVELFSQSLSSSGWVGSDGNYLRGENEAIFMSRANPGFYVYGESDFDYNEMHQIYNELIVVRVQYVWPKLIGC